MCRREPWAPLAVAALLLGLAACNQNETMAREGRLKPLEAIDARPGGRGGPRPAWRPPVEGTVARGDLVDPRLLPAADGDTAFPLPLTRALLERGRGRYDVFCQPCHSRTGDGDGMVVLRGFTRPPSFHTEPLRAATDAHVFRVITDGLGAMPAYGAQVDVRDRWAIVAYLRALQLHRHAEVTSLPPDVRRRLDREAAR